MQEREFFPDGTPIDEWFYDTRVPELSELGKPYVLTDYDIQDDGRLHTKEIQALIDRIAEEGGGVLVVPPGIYETGALFFKQGVSLYVDGGGVLRGSDDISDYPLMTTRIEGQTCPYFAALINVIGLKGFTMCGPGTIDGHGVRSWRSFWLRRNWNIECTNKDEHRARLVFIADCEDVLVAGLHLQNSQFWTNHLYRSRRVKYIGCRIFSQATPLGGPSTDALDIDVCTDVLVKNCRMEVNDDAVVLKGGKGPWADEAPENGMNERILVEDCTYGFCHGCLVCGSESIHNRNVIMRRVQVDCGNNLLWLKMRPDTPQHYEYITVDDVHGKVVSFFNVNPWTQFYDTQGRTDIPLSLADHVTVKNCTFDCEIFMNVRPEPSQYRLADFTLENVTIRTDAEGYPTDAIENLTMENVSVELTGNEPTAWNARDNVSWKTTTSEDAAFGKK